MTESHPETEAQAPTTDPIDLNHADSENRETEEEEFDPRDSQIAALVIEREALKDQLLRAVAENQNVVRRLRDSFDKERKYAVEPLVSELIPVLDNFQRALSAAEKNASYENLLEGVKAIDKQIRRVLEQFQVTRIASVGSEFDPERHEALVVHETDEHPEDMVIDEIEAGYQMHEKVIRPARVRVSKKP
ncbi:MAG: nucleotide exchange factor GrpE [Fimbriimonadaceae bacterium]|jgi:molecular chaperone GrpE|nr:nucleotide exchange factor GrpE [Fimbriimonadaceae bacterium]